MLGEAVVRLLRAHGEARVRARAGGPALGRPGDPRRPRLPRRRAAHRARPVLRPRPEGAAAELLERLERRDPSAIVRSRRWPRRRRPDGGGMPGDGDAAAGARGRSSAPTATGCRSWSRSCWRAWWPPASCASRRAGGRPAASSRPRCRRACASRWRGGSRGWTLTRRVVGAAAVLGRRFDWELVPGIADVDGRAAADALRTLVDRQLVEVDGGTVSRSGTPHPRGGPRRPAAARPRELARRARPVVERANPGLPGSSCELVAELAEAAGDPVAAAAGWSRALDAPWPTGRWPAPRSPRGAPTASPATDEAVASRRRRGAVHVLVAAGKPGEALEIGRGPGGAGWATPRWRRSGTWPLLLTLARAAVGAGACPARCDDVAAAGAAADGHVDDALAARIARGASTPHVALEQGRAGDAGGGWRARGGRRRSPPGSPPSSAKASRSSGGMGPDAGGPRCPWDGSSAPPGRRRAGLATWHLRARAGAGT